MHRQDLATNLEIKRPATDNRSKQCFAIDASSLQLQAWIPWWDDCSWVVFLDAQGNRISVIFLSTSCAAQNYLYRVVQIAYI